MTVTKFLLFAGVCLIVVLGRPGRFQKIQEKKIQQQQQRQEEEGPGLIQLEEENKEPFKVVYKVPTQKEESIADILWLKKAANMALRKGSPYFNVLEQSFSKRYVPSEKEELSVVDGIIQLSDDPMETEFDAHEINELTLNARP